VWDCHNAGVSSDMSYLVRTQKIKRNSAEPQKIERAFWDPIAQSTTNQLLTTTRHYCPFSSSTPILTYLGPENVRDSMLLNK